jgi:hypothetical protein
MKNAELTIIIQKDSEFGLYVGQIEELKKPMLVCNLYLYINFIFFFI